MNVKLPLYAALLLSVSLPVYAQENMTPQDIQEVKEEVPVDPVMEQIHYLQTQWAKIKYHIPEEDAQLDAIHKLEAHAEKVTAAYPSRAEPKIWEGIILSTDAGIVKGISALGKVKKAKALFEESLKNDPARD